MSAMGEIISVQSRMGENAMNELLTRVLEGARWSGALAPPLVHDLTTLQNPGFDRMGGRDPIAGGPRPGDCRR